MDNKQTNGIDKTGNIDCPGGHSLNDIFLHFPFKSCGQCPNFKIDDEEDGVTYCGAASGDISRLR